MTFDFDAPIDRAGTWSTRWERHAGSDIIPLWVADTDFRAAPAILEAMSARIVDTPQVTKAGLKMRLCTADGIVERNVLKRDKAAFKAVAKKKWGDAL